MTEIETVNVTTWICKECFSALWPMRQHGLTSRYQQVCAACGTTGIAAFVADYHVILAKKARGIY
jgi:RNase P subunit RPR2